jgi:hypothetical protein
MTFVDTFRQTHHVAYHGALHISDVAGYHEMCIVDE